MTGSHAPIPRLPYAAMVGFGALVSIGAGVWVAAAVGGQAGVQTSVAAVLVIGVLLAVVPLMGPPLVTPDRWGMMVLAVSGIRTMLAMGGMLVLIEVQGLERRPVVYGLLTGTLLMMAIEAMAAVWLLSRRERARSTPRLNANGSSV